jgi:hypothetical protein
MKKIILLLLSRLVAHGKGQKVGGGGISQTKQWFGGALGNGRWPTSSTAANPHMRWGRKGRQAAAFSGRAGNFLAKDWDWRLAIGGHFGWTREEKLYVYFCP